MRMSIQSTLRLKMKTGCGGSHRRRQESWQPSRFTDHKSSFVACIHIVKCRSPIPVYFQSDMASGEG
jgi:hypothetical protein